MSDTDVVREALRWLADPRGGQPQIAQKALAALDSLEAELADAKFHNALLDHELDETKAELADALLAVVFLEDDVAQAREERDRYREALERCLVLMENNYEEIAVDEMTPLIHAALTETE